VLFVLDYSGFSTLYSIRMWFLFSFQTSRSDVFEEITFELKITEDVSCKICDKTDIYCKENYDNS